MLYTTVKCDCGRIVSENEILWTKKCPMCDPDY